MTTGGQDLGGAQAQFPPNQGVEGAITRGPEPLVNEAEISRNQICRIAESILEDASRIVTLPDSEDEGAEDIQYRVSLGTEHFPQGELTKLQRSLADGGDPPGFNLRQVYDPENQKAHAIYLVAGTDTDHPVALIWPSSVQIFDSGDPYDMITDPKEIAELSGYVTAIGADSYKKLAELREREDAEGKERGHRIRKRIGLAIGSLAAAAALTFGVPPTVEGVQHWNQSRIEQQAERRAADRAAELQRQADARQAKAEREAKVREFDKKYDIDASVTPIEAGTVGVAQPTDKFVDVKVPKYNSEVISQELAHDIRSPRAIDIHQASEGETAESIIPGNTVVKISVGAEQSFRVAHNGTAQDIIATYFNPATNQLEIRDLGHIDGTASTVTQVYIQLVAS